MRKRILAVAIAALCAVGVAGFSSSNVLAADTSKAEITGDIDNQDQFQKMAEAYVDSWDSTDLGEAVEQMADSLTEEEIARYQEWSELQDAVGEAQYIESEDYSYAEDSDKISINIVELHENGKIQFSMSCDSQGNFDYENIEVKQAVEDEGSLASRMSVAGVNTIMSICIVFVVLVFIACIISLFKFIPMLFGEKKEQALAAAPVAEVAPVTEDVTDDTEIVAVITAAIMASMGSEAPADGLHITSIKRRVNSKWKRS